MANSFSPQQIEEFLREFFDVVGARQYVGARYVPIFGRAGSDTVEWDDTAPYEPLTVVMHNGVSYVSRRYVPAGIQIVDTAYWVETYRFNAQVEQYRQQVLAFQDQIDGIRTDMESDYVPFPDEAHYPKYGTSGQVLSTLANGTTLWTDPVVPSDEQAEAVITEWLDQHPEATTTVTDLSITNAKIANDTIRDEKLVQTGGILSRAQSISDDIDTAKSPTDASSSFVRVSAPNNGATISGNVVTIPAGSTGNQTYLGVRAIPIPDELKGNVVHVGVTLAVTANISDKVAPHVVANGEGTTVDSATWYDGRLTATLTVGAGTTATYIIVTLMLTNTASLASNATMTLGSHTATFVPSLGDAIDATLEPIRDEIEELGEAVQSVTEDVDSMKTPIDVSSSFTRVDALREGATRTENVVTIPAGNTGNQTYLGVRAMPIPDELKGKAIHASVAFTVTANISDKVAANVIANGTGTTIDSQGWDGQKVSATITIAADTTATYILVTLKLTNTASLASNATMTLGQHTVTYDQSLGDAMASLIPPVVTHYEGKRLTCFGDSYTMMAYWQPVVCDELKMAPFTDAWGQSGGTLVGIYRQIDTIDTTADVCTVWIGTNDYKNGAPVGTKNDTVQSGVPVTYGAAMNYVCDWLAHNFAGKTVVFITPTYRHNAADDEFEQENGRNADGYIINDAGFVLEDYANMMVAVAHKWSYPCLDLFHLSGCNDFTYPSYYGADRLHPSHAGAAILAHKIAAFIAQQ